MEHEVIQLLQNISSTLLSLESRLSQPAASHTEIDLNAYPAFSWRKRDGSGCLSAVTHPKLIDLQDLVGIDKQKQVLTANTQQLLQGLPANNALLWGAKGTGKSSVIKGLLHRYYEQGLRVIEVDRRDLVDIPEITDRLRNSDKKFILFCDDLSFEAADVSYIALKVALDGGMTALPDNTVIYATSNRRHLLPETLAENAQTRIVNGEVHYSDAMEEKISLSERFGLWLAFYPFNDSDYLRIVQHWVAKLGLDYDDDIGADAIQWSRQRASKSGRCAYQYVIDLLGQQQKS